MCDWLNETCFTTAFEANNMSGTMFLINYRTSKEPLETWLRTNFDHLFIHEMLGWNIPPDLWPQNRTYNQFLEWYAVEIHSTIFDLENTAITKS